jgi:hypothetical protein
VSGGGIKEAVILRSAARRVSKDATSVIQIDPKIVKISCLAEVCVATTGPREVGHWL